MPMPKRVNRGQLVDVAELVEGELNDDLLQKRIKELFEKGDETKFLVTSESDYKEMNDAELSITHFISTEDEDRVGDIVHSDGGSFEDFKRNPIVLFGHDDNAFPVGKNLWLKVASKTNATGQVVKGVLAKTQFEDITGVGRACYELWKGGFLNASSIRFRPLQDGYQARYNDNGYFLGIDFTKWELFEYSIVDIPCNQEALRNALGKGQYSNEEVRKRLMAALEKGAIPYHKYPLADEGEAWDAGAEVKKATPDDLKKMCTWYDTANADKKSAYKLPHHKAEKYTTVWNGVKAAMGALLGARGGAKIPDADRKKVYSHLAKHYSEWGKTPPDFKEYADADLRKMFPENYTVHVVEDTAKGAIIAVTGYGTSVSFSKELLLLLADLQPGKGLVMKRDAQGELLIVKSGAVLSSANAESLQMAHDMVADVMGRAGMDVCDGYDGNPDEDANGDDSPRVGDSDAVADTDEDQGDDGKSFIKRLARIERMLKRREPQATMFSLNGKPLSALTAEQKQQIIEELNADDGQTTDSTAAGTPATIQPAKAVAITLDRGEYLKDAVSGATSRLTGRGV